MSIKERSRGRSREDKGPHGSPSLSKRSDHDSKFLRIFMALEVLFVKFVAHPMHVMPEDPSTVGNSCTILLLSAPIRRIEPSLQATARSWPIYLLDILSIKLAHSTFRLASIVCSRLSSRQSSVRLNKRAGHLIGR
jgi:hypothetical protein